MYDCAIIGGGPAGLEAAINLKIRNKSFVIFGGSGLSRKVTAAPMVQNYLGLPGVTGAELADAFNAHLRQMDIEITRETASLAYPMKDSFSIAAGDNIYEAKTLILATGVSSASLIDGEEELLGRGVSYCASCDAPLYKGKRVIVAGYTAESVSEANFLSETAAAVYFIPMGKFETPLNPEIEVVNGKPVRIAGKGKVSGIELEDRIIDADGIFILRESIAPGALVPGRGIKDGFIEVDEGMKTNIPGCFAAGDCTGKPCQYIRAAGQGLTAAFSAVGYLDKL